VKTLERLVTHPISSQPIRNIGSLSLVMSSRRTTRTLFAAAALLTALVGGPQVVKADGVGSAQQNVKQVAAELQNLLDQLGQLDEDYGKAQDKKAKVDAEVAVSKKSVADMQQRLKGEQNILSDMAVTNFTSGGSTALSPLFSDAATYSAAEQRDALGHLALDSGQGRIDDYQSLVIDLAKEQKNLQQKQKEAADLLSYLQAKQQSYTSLETAYKAKLAKAQADLGAAQVQAAQDAYMATLAAKAAKVARARAAADAAAAAQAAQAGGTTYTPPGRGGGTAGGGQTGGDGGGNNGGGNNGGVKIPPGTVHIPAVSGRAGAVVAAAISQLGVPYHFAQASPGSGFDCSGLTMWSWAHAGVSLSHSAQVQYDTTAHVPVSAAQPGDLLFFYSPIGHVGLYVGNGLMIHAPHTGTVVQYRPVDWGMVVGVGRPG
jgi:cell wall-associated NlpC family hydrolase